MKDGLYCTTCISCSMQLMEREQGRALAVQLAKAPVERQAGRLEQREKENKKMKDQNTTARSKFLSLVLRHSPETIGLMLDEAGWARTDELLACLARSGRPTRLEELQRIVADNNKQRYSFSADGKRIRANQGHSIKVELGLEASSPPAVLYHGTATRFLDAIFHEGLDRQSRHHVHLSDSVEVAAQVGSRHGKLALLQVDAARMQGEGHVFYRSDNGVWLTDVVPVRYLLKLPS